MSGKDNDKQIRFLCKNAGKNNTLGSLIHKKPYIHKRFFLC